MYRIGIDVGGTNTDAVLMNGNEVVHAVKMATSADVMASFNRYNKLGIERSNLANAEKWEAPDANTFVIKMKKAQPGPIQKPGRRRP